MYHTGTVVKTHLAVTLINVMVCAITLKDASDRGRLGASTFRTLNESFMMAGLGLAALVAFHNRSNLLAVLPAVGGLCFVSMIAGPLAFMQV